MSDGLSNNPFIRDSGYCYVSETFEEVEEIYGKVMHKDSNKKERHEQSNPSISSIPKS
jgi:hypothetical protein